MFLVREHRVAGEAAFLRALDLAVPIGALDQAHHEAQAVATRDVGHGVDHRIFDELYKVAVGDFRPDLTLVLDLPIETGLLRAAARRGAETRYESLPRDFHARVRSGFLEIAAQDPKRCMVIDATGSIDSIAAAIAGAASERLGA